MRTIEQLKKCAKFYPKGSIIPERVLSIKPRRNRHTVKFGSDAWVFGIGKNREMIVAVDSAEPGCYVIMWPYSLRRNQSIFIAKGGKYNFGGVVFAGNCGLTDEEWAANIEKCLGSDCASGERGS